MPDSSAKNTLPKVSTAPTSSDAISAPVIEPMPPITTTTKQMISTWLPSVYPGMGNHVLIICFVVVVIGGIGSITGALIASLLVGAVDTFGKVFFAELSGIGVYVLMAVILVWRPEGLMKRSY